MRHESLHLRSESRIVRGVDALAIVWGVSRNEAANRLLDEGVARHINEVAAFTDQLRADYRRPPPGESSPLTMTDEYPSDPPNQPV